MGGAEEPGERERARRRSDRHVVAAHRLRGVAAPLLPLLGVLVGWSEEPLGLVAAAVVGIGAMVALLATNSWTVRGPAPTAEVAIDTAVSLIVCALVAGDALAAAWLIALIPALEAMVRLPRRSALTVIGVLGAGLVLIQLALPSPVTAPSTFTSLTITFVAIAVVVRVCLAVVDEIRIERRLGAVLRREGRRRGDLLQALGAAVRRMEEVDPVHAVASMSIEVGAHHAYVVEDGEVIERIVERSSSTAGFVTDATLVAVAEVGRARYADGLRGPHAVSVGEVGEGFAAQLASAEHVALPVDGRAVVVSLAAVVPGPLVANALEIAARHAAAARRRSVV
ncbi:MAG: hypothetical protein AAFZ07_18255 [Actinomycetota bacterium]